MPFNARVIADSIAVTRLTTFEITMPKMVVAEFNTHCMIARNSASSRAIPVERILAAVESDPVIPEFGLNGAGMQARVVLEGWHAQAALDGWLGARDSACVQARRLLGIGVHKQVTNRLLEPWMFTTIVATAEDRTWRWFFKLRCATDAQPEIRKAALLMREAYESSVPQPLYAREDHHFSSQWHLPYIDYDHDALPMRETGTFSWMNLAYRSAARCARISYLRQHEERAAASEIERANDLIKCGHWSPLEHQAVPCTTPQRGKFRYWAQLRHQIGDGFEET